MLPVHDPRAAPRGSYEFRPSAPATNRTGVPLSTTGRHSTEPASRFAVMYDHWGRSGCPPTCAVCAGQYVLGSAECALAQVAAEGASTHRQSWSGDCPDGVCFRFQGSRFANNTEGVISPLNYCCFPPVRPGTRSTLQGDFRRRRPSRQPRGWRILNRTSPVR